jgi:hypothetical protein
MASLMDFSYNHVVICEEKLAAILIGSGIRHSDHAGSPNLASLTSSAK